MTNAEKFLQHFRELELIFSEKGGKPQHDFAGNFARLKSDPTVKLYENWIETFRELRNAIVHKSSGDDELIAEPHPNVIEQISKVIEQLKNPKTAFDICVKYVGSTTYDETIETALNKMLVNGWTILPVLDEKGHVDRVLSEYSIAKAVGKNTGVEGVMLIASTVKDIYDYLDKPDESNLQATYFFTARKSIAIELEELFLSAWKVNRRINAVFVTESGLPDQKLLGLITPWDLVDLD